MFTTIEQTRVLYRNKWDPKNRRFGPHVQQACKEGEGRLPPSCSSFLKSNLEFVAAFNVHAWKHKAERKKVGRKGRKTAGLRNRKGLATFFGRDRSANKKVLPLSPEQTNEGLLARTVPQRWKEGFHSKRRLATANCKSASQKMSSIEFFWRKRQENTFPPPKKCKVSPLRKKSRKRSQFPSRKQKKILPNFRRDDNR